MLLAHQLDVVLAELVLDVVVVDLRLLPGQLPRPLLRPWGRQLRVGRAGPTRARNVIETGVLEFGCKNKDSIKTGSGCVQNGFCKLIL